MKFFHLLLIFPSVICTPFKPRGGSRIIAKNEEETKDLSVALPLSQSGQINENRDAPLMKDIEVLSGILSDIVETEDATVHDLYEEFRKYGLDRASGNEKALQQMIDRAKDLSADQALGVLRTFSIMLNLVNAAEVHHRSRVTRQHDNEREQLEHITDGPLPLTEDSIRGTMDALLQAGIDKKAIFKQLTTQKVEIVLTAHPTQVQRKSLLRKYRKISETLALLDRPDLDGFERTDAKLQLRRIISSIWGADEIRRQKPTVQQEAAGGNAILESVLWDAVPAYLRKLDQQCRMSLGERLPVDVVPIKFASWIGGDRDGNPNVTPEVTHEVVLQQRLRAARLFHADLYRLMQELAISSRFGKEMDDYADTIPVAQHRSEKYRRVLGYLIERMSNTASMLEEELADITESSSKVMRPTNVAEHRIKEWQDAPPIENEAELMEPLRIMYDSLVETGFELVADGFLSDIMRRVTVFGLSLLPLDIREESTKHTEALDAVTRWLGIGSYKEWDENARLNWLTSELGSKRPLFREIDTLGFDAGVVKTLRTFASVAKLHPSSLGAYVISQAQSASDVLAVMLLQKQFGMTLESKNLMRVVPLFETLNDLTNAPQVLQTLFSIPVYVGKTRNKQEVMVGYSDSAKDAGRLAACWAQYNSQVEMAAVAERFGINLTFFHGKGGTVGRGGNPSVYRAILSHPPDTIKGKFRVTEQGEMIMQNFGTVWIAERTLDIYTAALCREAFVQHVIPSKKWTAQMQKISDLSCKDYRHLVREEPRFVPYFRQATPELELGSLNIGSRPAKRNPKGGIESLRAIPWTFAWTQTRTHLSAWLGVGAGLHTTDPDELETLRAMYKEWPWFRETIDLIAMILSKTDFSIGRNYDDQLVEKKGGLEKLGSEVRDKLVQTRQSVLDVTESKDVSGAHVALQRASNTIRHPYVDPINVMQTELLKRIRSMDKKDKLNERDQEEKERLKDALVISINGVAQGMRNSG